MRLRKGAKNSARDHGEGTPWGVIKNRAGTAEPRAKLEVHPPRIANWKIDRLYHRALNFRFTVPLISIKGGAIGIDF